jgi:hypothetical protein
MKVRISVIRMIGFFTTMILILLCICSCKVSKLAPEKTPTKADLAAKMGIEESIIDEAHLKNPKVMFTPSVEDEFAPDRVIIGVYEFAYQYDYIPEDFVEVSCESVQRLFGPYEGSDVPTRYLLLELNTGSKEQLIEAIKLLQQRADIYAAEPDYIAHIA